MKTFRIVLIIFCLQSAGLCQNSDINYIRALTDLDMMLNDVIPLSFKQAVLRTEKAFLGDQLNEADLESEIDFLISISKSLSNQINLQNYEGKDKKTVTKYAAIFKLITDTLNIEVNNTLYQKPPYTYDFHDVFGEANWQNMFVSKLLSTKKGNCHSLPYLYKILCEGNDIPCHFALAPNHIYIKHFAVKGGWYNTELTSASFPIDAWLMASGYVTLQAVQNGVYLDTLSEKQSIALSLIDLAQGFARKYPKNDGEFIVRCCDIALHHLPYNINATLLKAETLLSQLQTLQKIHKFLNLNEVAMLTEGKSKWDEMNRLYFSLFKFGYKQMPEQMYLDWINSLNIEKTKYMNKEIPR
jgi:hypothetical protein